MNINIKSNKILRDEIEEYIYKKKDKKIAIKRTWQNLNTKIKSNKMLWDKIKKKIKKGIKKRNKKIGTKIEYKNKIK